MRQELHGAGAGASTALQGAAEAFLPRSPLARYLRVETVARKALAETTGYRDGMFMGFRACVAPSTVVGPYRTESLYDRVIKFGPQKRTR